MQHPPHGSDPCDSGVETLLISDRVSLAALSALAGAIGRAADGATLVRAIAQHAASFFSYERVVLAIKSADDRSYRLWHADQALGTVVVPERATSLRKGVLGWVFQQGVATFTQNVSHDGPHPCPDLGGSARGGLALPLFQGGEVFGVLCFEASEGQSIPDSGLQVAELVAVQAATAARSVQLAGELGIADEMIYTLATAIEAKDPYTQGHCDRVANYAVAIGRRFGLSPLELRHLHKGAFLHDVGKIGVRDAVLLKEGPLTQSEYEHIKEHPTIGARILRNLPSAGGIVPTVLYHHERWDGRGYPDGLIEDESPLLARIVSVADAFDAMTTTRCYRPALTCEQALGILETYAGTQWDPEVVVVFLAVIRERIAETGSFEPLQVS